MYMLFICFKVYFFGCLMPIWWLFISAGSHGSLFFMPDTKGLYDPFGNLSGQAKGYGLFCFKYTKGWN